MIETSEQGNDIVDRINACEKRYLMGKCAWLIILRQMIANQE